MAPQSESHEQHKLSPSHAAKTQASTGLKRPAIHVCPQPGCTRRFNRKYTLAEHIKTHTGERPHVCPVRTCGKRFSTSGNLSRHKRLHGYIEPLQCPVQGCICTFPSNNKLEKHMKFHYGAAVKVCLVPGCGKTFTTTGNMNRHLKHQHPDLPAGQIQAPLTPTVTLPLVVVTAPQVMPPQFLHRSPTSAEQWPVMGSTVPVFKPRVTTCWPQQITVQQQQSMLPLYGQQVPQSIYSPTRSCSELFEDVWNSEMLDTLVSALHDPTVRC
ncbi:hypothetical protein PF005_g27558 [Phytophthora fragariae]|uniref:C2H2-type domain-containing protein n=1 Tax=Phytophthora fragariae TaxID=53985 RepID=A0A6A4B6U9_9STRA|nr:hypothetical protein PF003_g500 [Phytophthora fragariae]KAE8921859.1 hypothetical protein PF009_g27870 [Phytophthora fragariae]KAE8963893.1 hypothetical protein PF011_g28868 [Phytophthora fragariae]KAE9068152.1 hypothetical protein PF010_g27174 [Phytophthora fragariae]KAE9068962.1 hypothetical protein PF007_g27496 [Phytophthora fragariae]